MIKGKLLEICKLKLLISYNYRLRRRTVSRWCRRYPGSDCFLTLSIIHDPKRKHTLIKINKHHENIAYTQGQQLQTTGAVSIRRDVISCLQITPPPAHFPYRGPSPSCLLFSKSGNHHYYPVNLNKWNQLTLNVGMVQVFELGPTWLNPVQKFTWLTCIAAAPFPHSM